MRLEDETFTSTGRFDALDRQFQSTDAFGRITLRKYDLLGGLIKVATSVDGVTWTAHVTNIEYAADGNATRTSYGNGSQCVYTYDDDTRTLLNKKTWRKDGTLLEDLTYTYDVLGQLSHTDDNAHEDVYFRNKRVDPSRDYTYDKFGRLLQATGRTMVDASNAGVQNPVSLQQNTLPVNGDQLTRYLETYTYDEVDNIRSMSRKSADTATADWTRTYRYDNEASNKLSWTSLGKGDDAAERYEYNAAGCITLMSGYSSLEWDSFYRLKSSSRQKLKNGVPETTYFVYNHVGERVRKITERASTSIQNTHAKLKESLYLPMCELTCAFLGDGTTKKREVRTSHVTDQPEFDSPFVLIEVEPSSNKPELVRYNLNTGLEVDDRAQVVSYEEYSPFGMTTLRACGSDIEAPSSFRYAAYRRDTETGLYYCKARYYAPWLGRWTAPDPLDTADGLNLFVYCTNDPINYTDPEGTMQHAVDINGPPAPQPVGAGRRVWNFIKDWVIPPVKEVAKQAIVAAVNAYANAQISAHPESNVFVTSLIAYGAAGATIYITHGGIDLGMKKLNGPTKLEQQVTSLGGQVETLTERVDALDGAQPDVEPQVADPNEAVEAEPTYTKAEVDLKIQEAKENMQTEMQAWMKAQLMTMTQDLREESLGYKNEVAALQSEVSSLKDTISQLVIGPNEKAGHPESPPPAYVESSEPAVELVQRVRAKSVMIQRNTTKPDTGTKYGTF